MAGHRLGWALLSAVIGVACAWAWLGDRHAEPRHEGIKARLWLEQLVHPERERNEAALGAFLAMGADAAPVLAEALDRRDSPVKRVLEWGTARLGTPDLGLIPAANYRMEALEVLSRMGPHARGAVPAVLRLLERGIGPQEARRIQAILTAMDADVIAELLRVLGQTDDTQVVRVVLASWSELLADAVLDVELLAAIRSRAIGYLASTDDQVVIAAADVVGRMGSEGAAAIPSLIQVLRTPGWTTGPVAERVVLALGRIGRDPGQAVPVLAGCLAGKDALLRIRAVTALGNFGPDAAAAVPALEQALADVDPYVRGRAALALGRMGMAAAPAVGGLAAALSDQDESVQVAVIQALGEIGPGARPAVAQLHRAWSNKQSGLGRQVLAALARIEAEVTE